MREVKASSLCPVKSSEAYLFLPKQLSSSEVSEGKELPATCTGRRGSTLLSYLLEEPMTAH